MRSTHLLITAASLVAALPTLGPLPALAAAPDAETTKTETATPAATLTHRGAVAGLRVEASLEIGGDMLRGDQAAPERLSIAVEADAAYRQEPRSETATAARRWYDSGSLRVRDEERARLSDASETFVAQLDDGGLRVGSATRSLTRDEMHLVQLPADPLTLSGLLPADAVRVGDQWPIEADKLGPLLGLESVSLCEALAVLTDLTRSHARFRFAGTVHGASAGAATEITLTGVALVDRRAELVTQCNLALEERREIGPATPGLDTTAKLSVRCVVAEDGKNSESLPDAGLMVSYLTRIDGPRDEWTCEAPRAWRVLSRTSTTLSLGFVDENRLAAELLVRTLSGKAPAFDEFSAEARAAIESSGGSLIGAYQGETPTGLTSYAVHGHGQQDGEPVVWRHYVLASPDTGRGVSAVATVRTPTADATDTPPERAVLDRITLAPRGKIASARTNYRRK